MTVYDQKPARRWLTLSFLVTEKKPIRGSEPREQVRTAWRGSQNPQGRTWFSKTGRWFQQPTLRFSFQIWLRVFDRCRSIPDTRRGIQCVSVYNYIYFFAGRLNWNHLSVSQDIHLSLYCSVPPRKIMFCQTVLSVKKGKPGNKQSLNLRRAPCRRHACAVHRAVHRSGPAVVQRRPFFCLLKQNGCMHHATGAFTPRPRVLACSCFVSSFFPAPERRRDWTNCKQLVPNRQARKRDF